MGVKGLTTFAKNRQNHCSEIINLTLLSKADPISLIIDGSSLLYHLYKESKLDFLNGGDYPQFYEYLYQFFSKWKNIHLVIVFDGCTEPRKEGFC